MPRRLPPPPPNLIVQVIHTTWTKAARGGPAAQARTTVPEQVPLLFPATSLSAVPAYLLHTLRYDETNGFIAPLAQATGYEPWPPAGVPVGLGARLACYPADGRALMYIYRSPAHTGAPGGPPERTFRLAPGQWGQVCYNWRHAGEDHWWYEKWVYNLAWDRPPEPAMFALPPIHVYADLRWLR